jgi:hypothetical protein
MTLGWILLLDPDYGLINKLIADWRSRTDARGPRDDDVELHQEIGMMEIEIVLGLPPRIFVFSTLVWDFSSVRYIPVVILLSSLSSRPLSLLMLDYLMAAETEKATSDRVFVVYNCRGRVNGSLLRIKKAPRLASHHSESQTVKLPAGN